MTFSNVKLILLREMRDQLRDRRTLFMIAVLPILLYPLLGMSMLQVSQFMREQPTRVLVVGAGNFGELPPLFEGEAFAGRWFSQPERAKLLQLVFASAEPSGGSLPSREEIQRLIQSGKYEAALYFPPEFAARLDAFRNAIRDQRENSASDRATRPEVPSPEILYSTASDKSQIAFARISDVLHRWTEKIADDNLAASGVPKVAMRPFSVESADVADARHRGASMWSKILPVVLLLWALTGAFYPAIDLCAGEKERGTLETLLSSPAARTEIVVGKLLTVMFFSMLTAALNLLSIGGTAWMVSFHIPGLTMPPAGAIGALAVALVPIAALFSALCLALAAFARSTKEGQYYLMPVLLITMPLVVLPMSPGIELNLGNSLIPVSGVVLLLRGLLEGNGWQALQYTPAVAAVTLVAVYLSIRWAVEQFNSESVLFRESERLDLGLWLRHLLRDRQPTPTVAAAVFCAMVILMVKFFMSLSQSMPGDFGSFARVALATQLGVIAAPALLMTLFFVSDPLQTLLLRRPPRLAILMALLLAVALHPAAMLLQTLVQQLYPVSESVQPSLTHMQELLRGANIWSLLLIIAVVPAVCEELAFRGFILSGFRHIGRPWRAILLSAFFFGITHGILQQSLIACFLGALLGFLAVQTGSILPCMAFHALHNALAVLNGRIMPELFCNHPALLKFIDPIDGGGCLFRWPAIVVGTLSAVLLLCWFGRLKHSKSPEEQLEEAIERGEHLPGPLVPEKAACGLAADR